MITPPRGNAAGDDDGPSAAGGARFGPFTSANITPDESGRPAGLTWDEFRHLIRTGIDPDPPAWHPPLLQVMPWPVYGDMTDPDLRAVYEYLSSIPSIPERPAAGAPPPAP